MWFNYKELGTLPSGNYSGTVLLIFLRFSDETKQSSKVFLNFFKERHIFASQGTVSTRSAVCSSLTTSVAISHGVAHSFFHGSLGFSLIVMCDVVVTRNLGYQAQVLNTLLDQLSGGATPLFEERLEEDVEHIDILTSTNILTYNVQVW
ncbi:uncharacterized protein LOC131601242 [Vicia villosa]|uniref:uncharacterized protein LOC131601242 n=1 Tax=Vicia villosa TaxID=3911 RepID=UPI00273C37B3|nr:uncharacterized protein LOC131601242 [Vicia villosa]XP_058728998.1 uncharacterized protein LOC131601242 [Vicia villosa]XP_058728999.1 uncharacterized protein LOC131601242 [Vicia villosa]